MVEPVETAMFDAFDQAHAPQWRALRAHFYADNEKVKAATRELIDTSFRKLRGAEGAFELLQVGRMLLLWPLIKPTSGPQHSLSQHLGYAADGCWPRLWIELAVPGTAHLLLSAAHVLTHNHAELQKHQEPRSHPAADDE